MFNELYTLINLIKNELTTPTQILPGTGYPNLNFKW